MKTSTLAKHAALLGTLAALSLNASAHTPYFLPNTFDVRERGVVSLDATMGEELFIADRAFLGSVFYIMAPSGETLSPSTQTELQARTVVEHTLEEDGTYRFSTGWREGNPSRTYELNGETKRLRSSEQSLPEGATLISFTQGKLMAETYVTKGAPNEQALQPIGSGLEFYPQTHPNELFVDDVVALKVLLDGSPLAAAEVEVHLGERQAQSSEPLYLLTSDDQGLVTFEPEKAGIYMLRSRVELPSDDKSVPDLRYTLTLTVEIVD